VVEPIVVSQSKTGKASDSAAALPPLYVDLDGCLVRTNLLSEGLLAAMRDFKIWPRLPGWLMRGKAYLKARIAERVAPDVANLPYSEALVDYIKAERQRGRRVVLATAANSRWAEAVANHLGCFDAVIASDEIRNLRGKNKLEAITAQRIGGAFAYAGNSWADVPIWRMADAALIVNAPRLVGKAAARAAKVEFVVRDRPPLARSLVKALRPHQWLKNLLVFVPLLAAGTFADAGAWASTFLAFVAFCATASGAYVLNDLTDLSADRQHPRKRERPFASGAIPIEAGAAIGVVLVTAGILLGAVVSSFVAVLIGIYVITSLGYSLYLKERPLIDVFTLSFLYGIRLFVGGEASQNRVSLWLLAFAFFLFLGLALTKRVSELHAIGVDASRRVPNRGYYPIDTAMLGLMGVAASFTSSIVLALYLQDNAARVVYANPAFLWPLVPLLLFWQCRLWLSTQRGYMLDDPIVYAARDWVSWLVFAVGAILVVLAHQPTFSAP
jgi:4-hydroxybenzoate polyprenyltransferase